ncbi:TRAP transporter substrate-binding protein [Caballeronia sp. 15711]|uniref:TRAP transporter substrate-binding protein n=1 Tax=Caballeronia sp. 15711 TaxID=3391029 RepID=UPI0039E26521
MNILSRRGFLAAAALASMGAFSARGARAAEFNYKIAHGFPPAHPISIDLAIAAKEIERQTAGALHLEVLGAGQLGGDASLMSQVRQGSLEFHIGAGSVFASTVPVASIWTMGFAFSSYAEVWKAVDGDLGGLVRNAVSKAGMTPLYAVWDNGFRQIGTVSKPIQKVENITGLKMRVPQSPVLTTMFKALGAAPVSLSFAETYAALQTRLVDGFESPLSIFASGNYQEVLKHVSMTNHVWDGGLLVANTAAFNAMPSDMRTIVMQVFNAQAIVQRKRLVDMDAKIRTGMSTNGVSFVDPNTSGFKELLRSSGFYKEWRERLGESAWAVLKRYAPSI